VFLEQNPGVDRDSMFVDDYEFGAYKAVGFQSFTDVDKETVKNVKITAPDLGFGQWMSYAGNVMKLSPVDGVKFGEIPEGVLRLGGTFVVRGDDVKYQWSDRIPGDHPDIEEVLEIAQREVTEQKKKGEKLFFGLF